MRPSCINSPRRCSLSCYVFLSKDTDLVYKNSRQDVLIVRRYFCCFRQLWLALDLRTKYGTVPPKPNSKLNSDGSYNSKQQAHASHESCRVATELCKSTHLIYCHKQALCALTNSFHSTCSYLHILFNPTTAVYLGSTHSLQHGNDNWLDRLQHFCSCQSTAPAALLCL